MPLNNQPVNPTHCGMAVSQLLYVTKSTIKPNQINELAQCIDETI